MCYAALMSRIVTAYSLCIVIIRTALDVPCIVIIRTLLDVPSVGTLAST